MRRVLRALAVVGILTSPAAAQESGPYARIVRQYAAGNGGDALAAFLRLPHTEAIGAAKVASATLNPHELVAAAVLHTEAALSIIDGSPLEAVENIESAQALLRLAGRDPVDRARVDAVARRWYYFAGSLLVSATQMQQAAFYIREGLLAFPSDAWLYFVRGTISEMSIQIGWNRDLRHELPQPNTRERSRMEEQLKRAVDDYQRALNVDPHLSLAHLHIGWTRMLLGDGRAHVELEAAAANATTNRQRYLAHLFLGGAAEQSQHLEDARREYEAALSDGPGFQSAYLALSRVVGALGDRDRAHALAVQCAELRKDDPDPWWDFVVAFDREALADLRAAARTP